MTASQRKAKESARAVKEAHWLWSHASYLYPEWLTGHAFACALAERYPHARVVIET